MPSSVIFIGTSTLVSSGWSVNKWGVDNDSKSNPVERKMSYRKIDDDEYDRALIIRNVSILSKLLYSYHFVHFRNQKC